MSAQLEDGYLRIARELADKFCQYKLSGQEWQILWVIIRQTYGWGKKQDDISLTQFEGKTKMSRRKVASSLNKLEKKGVISRTRHSAQKGTTPITTFSIITTCDKWGIVPKKALSAQKGTRGSAQKGTKVVPKRAHTKDIKDTLKDSVHTFFEYFCFKVGKSYKLTDDRYRLIAKKLNEGYTVTQLKKATDNFVADDWEGRSSHLDPIYCIGKQRGKVDNLEKWLNQTKKKTRKEHIL